MEMTAGAGSEIRTAVVDWVDRSRDELVDMLRTLVGFASENPNLLGDPEHQAAAREQELACQRRVADYLRDLGATVDQWEIAPGRLDVVGSLASDRTGRSLMLNGHVDVVPAGDAAAWPHDPWDGVVEGGRLWGRGSSDMKGGLVAGLGALLALQRLGLSPQGPVLVESVVDEEVGGPGTREALARGYRADAVIVLEPTSGKLIPVEGGLEWLNVVVRGVAGHSAVRYKSVHAGGRGTAVNAIEKAAKILAAVQDYERYRGNTKVHPLLPAGITTINPGVIAGGSGGGRDGLPASMRAYSNMADYCVLGLSLKYLPDESTAEVKRDFEAFIAAVAATDPWLRDNPPEIEWGVNGCAFPPCDTPIEHPFLQTLSGAFEEVAGPPTWAGFEAVTDLAWLVEAGIPGVIYGPGSIDQAHGSTEYIELEDLYRATKVIALTILDWCGVA